VLRVRLYETVIFIVFFLDCIYLINFPTLPKLKFTSKNATTMAKAKKSAKKAAKKSVAKKASVKKAGKKSSS
jgi:hypothetical protein